MRMFLSLPIVLLGVSSVAVHAQRPPVQSVPPAAAGIVATGLTARGDTVTFQYTVTNPSVTYGLVSRIALDVVAPRAVGTQWLGAQERGFIDDALTMPSAAVGHPPLALTCPDEAVVGLWISGVSAAGELWCELYAAGEGDPVGLSAGRRMTWTVTGVGIPFLRMARMIPWTPLAVDSDGVVGAPTTLPFPAGVPKGREVRTVVPGPGLPAAALLAVAVKAQVTLACSARLLTPAACAALPGLIDARNRARALAVLGATPSPLLLATLVPQLRAYR